MLDRKHPNVSDSSLCRLGARAERGPGSRRLSHFKYKELEI